MRAVILAGGSGERLRPYTENLPKGMLEFEGMTVIERQLGLYRRNGIQDIGIATGYQANKINYPDVRYFHNPNYRATNMVETLFCARQMLAGEVIVSYADIVFEDRVLRQVLANRSEVGVVVDTSWKDYWTTRYGNTHTDIEGLKMDPRGNITEIGKPEDSPDNIDGRYVGLIKFSARGAERLRSTYDQARSQFWDKPWQTSSTFQKAYMTDILQALIESGIQVSAIKIEHGWLEFDTVEDYEKLTRLRKNGLATELFNP